MRTKSVYMLIAACVAGYIGGALSPQRAVKASTPEVVRATGFDLVDGSGKPVARWGLDSGGEAHISFLSRGDIIGLDIGVLADGRPFLRMGGRDGKRRIVMELDQADKPMLGMGDERWDGRVHIGFMPPDTFPYSSWDHWGVVLRAPGSERTVVGMGTVNGRDGPAEPFLTVSGKSIR
jgi:hypothetical protein